MKNQRLFEAEFKRIKDILNSDQDIFIFEGLDLIDVFITEMYFICLRRYFSKDSADNNNDDKISFYRKLYYSGIDRSFSRIKMNYYKLCYNYFGEKFKNNSIIFWPTQTTHLNVQVPVYKELIFNNHNPIFVTNRIVLFNLLYKQNIIPVNLNKNISNKLENKNFHKKIDEINLWYKGRKYKSENDKKLVREIINIFLRELINVDNIINIVKYLKHEVNTKILIIGNDLNPVGRIAALCAKELNLPTLSISHGNVSGYRLNGLKVVDKFCAFGQNDYNALLDYGCSPDTISITGSPYIDKIPTQTSIVNYKINKKLKISENFEHYCLITLSGPGPILTSQTHRRVIKLLNSLCIQYKTTMFIFKLHRKDNKKYYEEILSSDSSNYVIITNNLFGLTNDIYTWLQGCDFLITVSSAAATEAMLMEVPVVTIDIENNFKDISFIKQGATFHTTNIHELSKSVEGIINKKIPDESKKKSIKIFLNENYFAIDGRSSNRCSEEIIKLYQDNNIV